MAGKKQDFCYPDTTVAYAILGGHSLQREFIQNWRNGRSWRFSPIVRMEYIRGVVICLIEFHSLLLNSGSVDDAFNEWSDQFNQRKIRVLMRHVTAVLHGQDQSDDRAIVARRLGEYIRELLEDFDTEFQRLSPNRLNCKIAPMTFPSGKYSNEMLMVFFEKFNSVYGGTPDCQLCGFRKYWRGQLAKKGVDLCSAEQEAANPGKKNVGYRKQAQELRAALAFVGTEPDCKWCKRVGDSMIALQSRDQDTLIAGDRSFNALTTILGKKMKYVPSVAALKRGPEGE